MSIVTRTAQYQGNGVYTVDLSSWTNATCTGAGTVTTVTFEVGGFTAVAAPAPVLLTRLPDSFSTISHVFGIDVNPGAISHEVRYAAGGAIGPDGAISGPSEQAFVSSAKPHERVSFRTPGRYVFVGRVKGFSSAGDFFTPWSAPTTVTVRAPFDFSSVTFPDARGPSYRLRGKLREPTARGSVSVAIARGRKGGKFKSLGRARIRKATFSKRFTLTRPGRYRVRYRFKGSATVAAGVVIDPVQIRRRITF